jgi:MFS family permease
LRESITESKLIQNKVLIGLFTHNLIINVVAAAINIALTHVLEDNFAGESGFRFGLLDTLKFFASLIMLFPAVKISEKIGRKWTLFSGIFLVLIGLVILMFSQEYWQILFARGIMGLNSIMGILSALTCDHFSEEKRGKPLSFVSLGMVLGFLTGTLIGEPVFEWLGAQNVFLFLGILSSLNFLNVLIFIQDVPPSLRTGDLRNKDVNTWQFLVHNKRFLSLLIMSFLVQTVVGGASVFIVYIIFTHIGLGPIGGLFIIPCQIAQTITFLFVGIRVKHFERLYKSLLWLGGIIIAITVCLYFFDKNAYLFSFNALLAGIIYAGMMQSSDAISHKLIPLEHKTNMVSIYRIVGLIGNVIGPAILMFQVQYIWVYAPGIFLVLLQAIIFILYWIFVREKQQPPEVLTI